MKLVFMGTPDFAAVSLKRVIEDGYPICAVYTQPDKPKGRSQKLCPPPVKELAQEKGIPVFQPVKLRDGTVRDQLLEMQPDVIVVVAYGRILPKEILEIPPKGCINVHASLLPKYRGAGPIQWSIINGEAETGVTTMYMAEGMDTGDMILKRATPIGEEETADQLHDRLAEIGADCLSDTLKLLEKGEAVGEAQDESQVTLAPILEKTMAEIDFSKSSEAVHNLVRGMYSWPVAYTWLNGRRLKVLKAVKAEGSGAPGEVLEDHRLLVGCGEGAIELVEVQLEGAKRLSSQEFLRGKTIPKGTILGKESAASLG